MTTRFYINEILSLETQKFPHKLFFDEKSSLCNLYSFIANEFPNNNWRDIEIDNITYKKDIIDVFLSTY